MSNAFFLMHNNHAPGCGIPPTFCNDGRQHYFGYFENPHGEQWVFIYDRDKKCGELRGGDAGWEDVYQVHEGRVADLTLGKQEAAWLRACWDAVTRGSP